MCSIRSLSQLSSPSARLARAAPSRNKILTRKDRSHGSHGLSRAMVAGTATENRPDRKPWLKDGSSSQLSSQGTSWQNNFRESRSPCGEGGRPKAGRVGGCLSKKILAHCPAQTPPRHIARYAHDVPPSPQGGGKTKAPARTRVYRPFAPLLVPRHRRQLGHVLQQYAAALQVQNAVLAPELQLTVDAFAGGADEDAELLLRDVDFRSEVASQRAEPAGEADRQRLQHR